jgi:hypothetical protein
MNDSASVRWEGHPGQRFCEEHKGLCPDCGGPIIFTCKPISWPAGAQATFLADTVDVLHRDGCPEAHDCNECGAEVHPAGFVIHSGSCESSGAWDFDGDDAE